MQNLEQFKEKGISVLENLTENQIIDIFKQANKQTTYLIFFYDQVQCLNQLALPSAA
jgi:hypothetical protein